MLQGRRPTDLPHHLLQVMESTAGRTIRNDVYPAFKILELPEEPLLNFALRIESHNTVKDQSNREDVKEISSNLNKKLVRSLKSFSLTCRKFQNIGQEVMTRKAVITQANMWSFFEFLFQYPTLIKKITHVRFDPFEEDRFHTENDSSNATMNRYAVLYYMLQKTSELSTQWQ